MSEITPRTRPPFRADHVGSLLRPTELREARAAREAGRIAATDLRAVEDRCVTHAIAQQEGLGLRAATDGEYRRRYWHFDFLAGLGGVEMYEPEQKVQFHGATLQHALRVTGRIAWTRPVFVDDFRFTAGHAHGAIAKQTIPSPSVRAFPRRPARDRHAYLSRHGRLLRRSRHAPIATRCAASPMPAAAICSSTK